ncbi:hypothetical protein [Desertivirga arenae]|uniref:hypothetical protein n=1 Tax=Desertivirga arenae TaxID=2810309 RepID=UPI001A95E016|nr:hypothetical protein [Pedobacter sp. SYSU D00823]
MMRFLKIKSPVSFLYVLVLLISLAVPKDADAEECDPFSLDPNATNACDGGDADGVESPLDGGLLFLTCAGVLLAVVKLRELPSNL